MIEDIKVEMTQELDFDEVVDAETGNVVSRNPKKVMSMCGSFSFGFTANDTRMHQVKAAMMMLADLQAKGRHHP